MTGLKLYEIPERYRELEDAIIEAEGELTPEIEAELAALDEAFERKVEYIALLSREAKAEAEAVSTEAKRLAARRKAAENRESGLKKYLHYCLTSAGVERVVSDRVKVRIQANSRPSIEWEGEPEAIPEPFRRVTVSLDGTAVYEEYKENASLPDGFTVEWGKHVRVW